MPVVPLPEAIDESSFGGKAVQLGAAIRAGLPVPGGLAVSAELIDRRAAGATPPLGERFGDIPFPVAVRSSGVGEDSAGASFAGQHATHLNVCSPDGVDAAMRSLWESARSESALAYRRRLGLPGEPRIAAVVQPLVTADVAGVMFTRNPLDGGDDFVIEASWGLGEAVVAGCVVPDHYRVARSGEVLERIAGSKEVAIEPAPDGGTARRDLDPARAAALCLDDSQLVRLAALGRKAEHVFGGPQDVEWAFSGDELHLLQSRPITRVGG